MMRPYAALTCLLSLMFATSSIAGPQLGDTDGDHVDDLFDNCLLASNTQQVDSDGDGCGNLCDCDYDQNGACGGQEFSIFRAVFGLTAGDPGYREEVDHDANGAIGGSDFAIFRALFGKKGGPSLLPTRNVLLCP